MKKKILAPGICVLMLAIVLVVLSSGCINTTPEQAGPPAYISSFVVLEEGEVLKLRFSLEDEDMHKTSSDGTLTIKILDQSRNKTIYQNEFTVKKEDFKTYEYVFTGAEFLAYGWTIPFSDVAKSISTFGTAEITFITSDEKILEAEYSLVPVSTYTEEEVMEMYENLYLQSAITVEQNIINGDFSVTLVRVGSFTHLKYDTWGDEVARFRVDLIVTSIASEPEYIFVSDIVILDNLGNQYDYEYGGTLDLGEIYPGVTRKGYVLFPVLDENAETIRIIVTDTAYPEDIVYEFIVTLAS